MRKVRGAILVSLALIATTIPQSAVQGQTRKQRTSSRRSSTSRARRQPSSTSASNAAVTMPSGLTYVITHHGTGSLPKPGDTVVVHYTGTLTNGVKFDSSRDRGEPFAFPLGQGRVIKGWDEGIAQMHVGDQAVLIIPSQLGYGARGAGGGVIPPDATLIFVVELVDVKAASPAETP